MGDQMKAFAFGSVKDAKGFEPAALETNNSCEVYSVTNTPPAEVFEAKNGNIAEIFEAKNIALIENVCGESQIVSSKSAVTSKTPSPSDELPHAIEASNPQSQAYQEYVQRFTGRVSPFSNARDSIDIRKTRKSSKHSLSEMPDPVAESEKENVPSTSRRLEELSRERCKQRDLIHEMVINKLLAEGKSPTDRKSKRNARGSFSPLGLNGLNQAGAVNGCEHVRVNNLHVIARNGLTDEKGYSQKPDHPPIYENGASNDDITPTNEGPRDSQTTPSQPLSSANQNAHVQFSTASQSTPIAQDTPSSVFSTPMTSLRTRPLSVHSPPSAYTTPQYTGCMSSQYTGCLPSQSAPDIHGAVMNGDDVFTTPRRPPRNKQDFQVRYGEVNLGTQYTVEWYLDG